MDYRSPVREISNSHYNHVSGVSQQYEEQFWKLKAQRMETTIEELKKDNFRLNKQVVELTRI